MIAHTSGSLGDGMQTLGTPSVMVIGYGNDLRGDDAAGRRVADAIAAWALPGVQVTSLHQLVPELAEALAKVELAIFVDAYPATVSTELQIFALEPDDSCPVLEHSADPQALLTLTAAIYGHAPRVWFVGVPATQLDLGAPISPTTAQGIDTALGQIRTLIERFRCGDGS